MATGLGLPAGAVTLAPPYAGPDPTEPNSWSLPKVASDYRPWDRHERALVWSYVALNVVDGYQTSRIPPGFREGNPVFSSLAGERPSAGRALAVKTLGTYGILRLTDRFVHSPKKRKAVLYFLNAVQLFVVVRNERVTGGIVFH
ncbi:MAG TPA: hypothetical protein VJS92_13840 [Candidatus Polarisedimenticolaceae bacterium]|nr:hypothetical protein [Candidatus Polarisedimenticolaceae bacterium]